MNTDAYHDAYRALAIPATLASGQSSDTLTALLDAAAPALRRSPHESIVTTFDAQDPALRGYPRRMGFEWPSAQQALAHFRTRGVIMRLPLFYQLEPALARAGHAAGAFIFINDTDNMPIGAMAIADGSMDTVVTTADDALVFAEFLAARSLPQPRAWIVMHRFDRAWTLPAPLLAPGVHVAQEVHLFPGLPVLAQCTALMDRKAPHFHAAPRIEIDTAQTARISGPLEEPLPLIDYDTRIALEPMAPCVCGMPTFALTPSA